MSNKPNWKQHPAPRTGRASTSAAWWQSPFVWVLALVMAAGLVVAIVAAAGGSDETTISTPQTAFAETLGSSLPPFDLPDPALGMAAPAVSAQTMEGDRVQLGSSDGVARLYGFFAHWCPHCQAELPATAQWLESAVLPTNVEVVAVSTAADPDADNYPPSEWFVREEWPATVLLDSDANALASGFGLTAFPFWVAVDADGLVVGRQTGNLSEADLAALIAEMQS